jgi:hypothetical protein
MRNAAGSLAPLGIVRLCAGHATVAQFGVSDLLPGQKQFETLLTEHRSGRQNRQRQLFSPHVELWYRQFIKTLSAPLVDNICIVEADRNIMRTVLGVSEIHRSSNSKSARLLKSSRQQEFGVGMQRVRGTVFCGGSE